MEGWRLVRGARGQAWRATVERGGVCCEARGAGHVRHLHPAWLAPGMERRPAPHPPALQAGIRLESMWDVYRHTWLPFGGLLTDMEAVGMAVDRAHLAAAQQQAEADQAQAQERFRCARGAPTARSRVRQAGWARAGGATPAPLCVPPRPHRAPGPLGRRGYSSSATLASLLAPASPPR